DIGGRISIVLQVVMRIGTRVGEVTGREYGATNFLSDELRTGEGGDGIGSGVQQVVHGAIEAAIDDVDAVVGSAGQGPTIGGGGVEIVGAGFVGVAELSRDLLGVGTKGGVVVVRNRALVGPDEDVGVAIVGGDGAGGRGAVVVGGGNDEGKDIDLPACREGPQHGVIANIVSAVCQVGIQNNVYRFHRLLKRLRGQHSCRCNQQYQQKKKPSATNRESCSGGTRQLIRF